MTSPRQFALCADDFALSPAVSAGILEALAAGRLSATSAMTTQPEWPKAAAAFRDLKLDADLGLHFNLTLGTPLGPMPHFCRDGHFPTMRVIAPAAWRNALPKDEIIDELKRQLDQFEAHYGAVPDYVDGHQHVHVLPNLRHWLLEELDRRGLAGKVWLRDSSDTVSRVMARKKHTGKALTVAALAYGFANAAKAAGFSINNGFAGFSDFDLEQDFGSDFESYVWARGSRHLVMCHPGHVDEILRQIDPVTQTRESELAFLMSERFIDMLKRRNLVLARLSRMAVESAN